MMPTAIDPMLRPIPVALLGAGGRLGSSLTDNLMVRPDYAVHYVETSEEGIAHLATRALTPTPQEEALKDAEIVILALPDHLLGSVTESIVTTLKANAVVVYLNPAALCAGALPERSDIGYFVTHPCHPPVFNDENEEDRKDYFGGATAKQHIVCAMTQGTKEQYRIGEQLARAIYAPVMNAHRITIEQMALLEPVLAETVTACCITVIREAMDEVVKRGVPSEVARDFLLGHIHIPLAIVFGEVSSSFPGEAERLIKRGRELLFREDWKRVFEPEAVQEQIRSLVADPALHG